MTKQFHCQHQKLTPQQHSDELLASFLVIKYYDPWPQLVTWAWPGLHSTDQRDGMHHTIYV